MPPRSEAIWPKSRVSVISKPTSLVERVPSRFPILTLTTKPNWQSSRKPTAIWRNTRFNNEVSQDEVSKAHEQTLVGFSNSRRSLRGHCCSFVPNEIQPITRLRQPSNIKSTASARTTTL